MDRAPRERPDRQAGPTRPQGPYAAAGAVGRVALYRRGGARLCDLRADLFRPRPDRGRLQRARHRSEMQPDRRPYQRLTQWRLTQWRLTQWRLTQWRLTQWR